MSVEVRLLGPFEIVAGARWIDLGHARQRSVLAVLVLALNQVVSSDQLLDRVWGDRAPQRARDSLHSYLSRLRAALAPVPGLVIERRPPGYVLLGEPDAVDVIRFRTLVRRAATAGSDEDAERLLAEALSLWRGDALGSLAGSWFDGVRAELAEQRHAAELDRYDALLRLGRHAESVVELPRIAQLHPWDERITAQLMLSLYRCGRPALALETYQRLRVRLAEELGTDPGPAVRELFQQILSADPALEAPTAHAVAGAPAAAPSSSAPAVPRQLPMRPRSFVGRAAELAALDRWLGDVPQDLGPGIVVISGGGGLGKTWLALRWATDNVDRFPDGQLHADLAGFDPVRDPADPMTLLRGFLEALGVEPERIPAERDPLTGMFRSLTADRSLLIVLDNARDSDAVLPLLPGAVGNSRVLITSRRRLSGLAVTHGARAVVLTALPDDDAQALVLRRLGRDPRPAELPALKEITQLCGGVPLALAIVGARAAGSPEKALSATAEELRDEAARLDLMNTGEVTTDLRAALTTSHRALGRAAAAAFDLLGVIPGPDFGLHAFASLTALRLPEARAAADELVAAGLLHESGHDRYGVHDLVRLYAREQLPVDAGRDSPALTRFLDHYLHTAHAAEMLLSPKREPLTLPRTVLGVVVPHLLDTDAAIAWFTAELPALVAAVGAAGASGRDVQAHQLAWTLATFCGHRGRWRDWVLAQHVAVASARHCGDAAALAEALRLLGQAYSTGHQFEQASENYLLALDAFTRTGDLAGRAHVHFDLALLMDRQGRPADAAPYAERSLEDFRAAGDNHGVAVALNAVGWYHCELGDYRRGIGCCQQALSVARSINSVYCESNALDSLGYAYHHLGRYAEAIEYYRHALTLLREMGDRTSSAIALDHLGDSYQEAGDVMRARLTWQAALAEFEDVSHPEADQVRRKLLAPVEL
ncbi:MAG TPA: BTAD domain-containing putative transcriptional regulator [Mycobacteriales bacterium]|jgi:DNA-binding SARP family transcriptional activator/Tfp pilus assembly protein PilF